MACGAKRRMPRVLVLILWLLIEFAARGRGFQLCSKLSPCRLACGGMQCWLVSVLPLPSLC